MEPSWRERESFMEACKEGDTEKVKSLLSSFPSFVNINYALSNIHFFICFMKLFCYKMYGSYYETRVRMGLLYFRKKYKKKFDNQETRKEILRIEKYRLNISMEARGWVYVSLSQ